MKSLATMTLQNGIPKQAKGSSERSGAWRVIKRTNDLKDLFIDELKSIYWAEKARTRAIVKHLRDVTTIELAKLLIEQLEITRKQVIRLEAVFALIKPEKIMAVKCYAVESLLTETEEYMRKTTKGIIGDAAIILAYQRICHYEIATYGTLVSFSQTLGESEASALLQASLNEEKYADEMLTKIAEAFINFEAAGPADNDKS